MVTHLLSTAQYHLPDVKLDEFVQSRTALLPVEVLCRMSGLHPSLPCSYCVVFSVVRFHRERLSHYILLGFRLHVTQENPIKDYRRCWATSQASCQDSVLTEVPPRDKYDSFGQLVWSSRRICSGCVSQARVEKQVSGSNMS